MSKRILTGITTTGTPHIGNYLGAIKPALNLSKEFDDSYFFLADYHAIIKNSNSSEVQDSVKSVAQAWLASGLDPEKSNFYRQSDVPEKFLLIHGDSLCTDDINYQKLKKILRNPITQFIFLKLSKKFRLKLTGQLRKKSIEAQKYKTEELMDVNQEATDLLMSKYPGFDLIHGHTHRQKTHTEEKYSRHVLGDWSNAKGNAIKISDKLEWLEINCPFKKVN